MGVEEIREFHDVCLAESLEAFQSNETDALISLLFLNILLLEELPLLFAEDLRRLVGRLSVIEATDSSEVDELISTV